MMRARSIGGERDSCPALGVEQEAGSWDQRPETTMESWPPKAPPPRLLLEKRHQDRADSEGASTRDHEPEPELLIAPPHVIGAVPADFLSFAKLRRILPGKLGFLHRISSRSRTASIRSRYELLRMPGAQYDVAVRGLRECRLDLLHCGRFRPLRSASLSSCRGVAGGFGRLGARRHWATLLWRASSAR